MVPAFFQYAISSATPPSALSMSFVILEQPFHHPPPRVTPFSSPSLYIDAFVTAIVTAFR
jgi:hypothetical protein